MMLVTVAAPEARASDCCNHAATLAPRRARRRRRSLPLGEAESEMLSEALLAVWGFTVPLSEKLVDLKKDQPARLPPLEKARLQGQADMLRVLVALLRDHSEALEVALRHRTG